MDNKKEVLLNTLGIGRDNRLLRPRIDEINAKFCVWVVPFFAVINTVLYVTETMGFTRSFLSWVVAGWPVPREVALVLMWISSAFLFCMSLPMARGRKMSYTLYRTIYYICIVLGTVYSVYVATVDYALSAHVMDFAIRMLIIYCLLYMEPMFLMPMVVFGFLWFVGNINVRYAVQSADNRNMAVMMSVILVVGVARYSACFRRVQNDYRLEKLNERLQRSSHIDELTGLKNRHAFREDFDSYIKRKIVVMMADIDDFKSFNDTYGHDVGDMILKGISRALMDVFGAENCYRYGGDEVLVIAEMNDLTFARQAAIWKRKCGSINVRKDLILHPGLSGGYIYGYAATADDLNQMVRLADAELYKIKNSGKGKIDGFTYNYRDEKGQQELLDQMRVKQSRKSGRTDSLTGFPDISEFRYESEPYLKAVKAQGGKPIVLYFNIENLKALNENYGFTEGDRLLKATAKTLTEEFPGALKSHFGEDHFVVLTADTPDLHEKLSRIHDKVMVFQKDMLMTIKAGIYYYDDDTKDISTACDRAKAACDSIHHNFSQDIKVYDRELDRKFSSRQYVIDHFNEALENGDIVVYYQPLIRNEDGQVCGMEALSRWKDPYRGIISPGDYIPYLEELHLINKLDIYMLRRICIELNLQKSFRNPVLPVSFNISRIDFELCDMVQETINALKDYDIPHEMVRIEITESALARNPEFLNIQINRFHKAGFKVWMDDFGSGYSTLNILSKFHFDLVKLDMVFMQGLAHEKKDDGQTAIILVNMIAMLRDLGIQTLAEGVEKEDQFTFLQDCDCDMSQGFLFGVPMCLEDLIQWEKEHQKKLEKKDSKAL